jgi:hypothetical protein
LAWSFVLCLLTLLVAIVLLRPIGWWLLLVTVVMPVVAIRGFAVAELPRTVLRPEDLRPLDREARWLRMLEQIGEPALWAFLLLAGVLVFTGVRALVADPTWVTVANLVMFIAMTAAPGWGLWLLRSNRK